ncbi:MAG: putative esterase [Saprospiraceae bacterium]|jgi:predicted esterase
MDIIETKIQIARTGVFYKVGTDLAQRHWFCCHGYAQVADLMINKFDRREAKGEKVVCVEAPNRFYWKGVRGNPVTTWMTSRYRLDEIRDNNDYLNKVFQSEINQGSEKVLFGFSQGGTTMWRWIHDQRPEFDVFVNYAGWIPEDLDLKVLSEYLKGKRLVFIYGTQDEYLTKDRIEALEMIIERSGLDIKVIKNAGNHSIDRDTIDLVLKK